MATSASLPGHDGWMVAKTPAKTPRRPRAQTVSDTPRRGSENFNPNLPLLSSPPAKKQGPSSSPAGPKSVKKPLLRSAAKVAPPPPPPSVRERKFIVARKNGKGKEDRDEGSAKARLQAAREALLASHEEFFRNGSGQGKAAETGETAKVEKEKGGERAVDGGEVKEPPTMAADPEPLAAERSPDINDLEGTVKVRKMRSRMLEKAMGSMPEPGAGRVMYLVKVFESALSISKDTESEEPTEKPKNKAPIWPLPGLQQPPRADVPVPDSSVPGLQHHHPRTDVPVPDSAVPGMQRPPRIDVPVPDSAGALSSGRFSFPPEDFGGDYQWIRSSLDGGIERSRLSLESKASAGNRRNRRHSSDSLDRIGNRRLRVTNLQPFKLRTEQRGRMKQEMFLKKVQDMLLEQAKKRIPIAQGLPWTTDEPECLIKPPVKESTEPLEVVLHSDIRAMERAQFDQYVAERTSIAEQLKLERERQRKQQEEEEVRRLRKVLVPKAQPMPYFDRPFVPKRSGRPRTVPKEPRFHHTRAHKQCVEDQS